MSASTAFHDALCRPGNEIGVLFPGAHEKFLVRPLDGPHRLSDGNEITQVLPQVQRNVNEDPNKDLLVRLPSIRESKWKVTVLQQWIGRVEQINADRLLATLEDVTNSAEPTGASRIGPRRGIGKRFSRCSQKALSSIGRSATVIRLVVSEIGSHLSDFRRHSSPHRDRDESGFLSKRIGWPPSLKVTEAPPRPHELEISVFGPGIGECIVVHIGDGDWIIVDSCINKQNGEPVALDYLRSLEVDVASKVKLVIATHWHDDHIRGLAKIVGAAETARFVNSAAYSFKELLRVVELGTRTTRTASRQQTSTMASCACWPNGADRARHETQSVRFRRWRTSGSWLPNRSWAVGPSGRCLP